MNSTSFLTQKKAASGTEAGLLIGLIAVGLLTTLTATGTNLAKIFSAGENTLQRSQKPITNIAPVWDFSSLDQDVTLRGYMLPSALTLPTATDADGDSLTYAATGSLYGLSFDPETRTLSGTPTTSGSLTLSFTVTDGYDAVQKTVPFTVTEPTTCETIVNTSYDVGDGTYSILGDQADNAALYSVSCDMTRNGGGWTSMASYDYATDSTPPGSFSTISNAWSTPSSWAAMSGSGVRSVGFSVTPSFAWKQAMIDLQGVNVSTPDGFCNSYSTRNTVEDQYVDGFSLTFGSAGSRQHIYTIAAALRNADCTPTSGVNRSGFIGSNYSVQTGTSFSQSGILSVTKSPDTSPIELRAMLDQAASDERVGITKFELWVK